MQWSSKRAAAVRDLTAKFSPDDAATAALIVKLPAEDSVLKIVTLPFTDELDDEAELLGVATQHAVAWLDGEWAVRVDGRLIASAPTEDAQPGWIEEQPEAMVALALVNILTRD